MTQTRRVSALLEWIAYFVDTGNSQAAVIGAMTGSGGIDHHSDCPVFNPHDVKLAIQDLIDEEQLTRGPAYGHENWLKPAEFHPLAPGARVLIYSGDLKGCPGTVTEYCPDRGGYLVQPDGDMYSPGGFGYSEVKPIPRSTKTRWDRILENDL